MATVYFSHNKIAPKMSGVHVHEEHELYYLAKGRTKYLIDDEIYPVEQGNVVFIPKGHYHMTDSGENHNVERYLISFDDALFDSETRIILDELFEKRLINIPINRTEGLEELFSALERSLSIDGAIGDAVRKIHALSILSFVCRHKRAFTPKVTESDKIIHCVSEYVSANYQEDLTLSTLSKRFSLSESYLSRKFKEVSGIGLGEYITYVRIMNAEKLLKENNPSITSVAERCGFTDSNYFSTVFKKIKGVTPLKFSRSAHSRDK